MNAGHTPSPADSTDEVSELIETLLETGQRLEDLTAGEVDAVADRNGRTFLLRRAQDQLRHNEAAKQFAILNALPAHIAMLDTLGLIVSVNEAWRRFAATKVIQAPGYGMGLNYLEICDHASGDGAAEAHQVAQGIRSVLSGASLDFSIEYACHSPTEQRWFLMTATPLSDEHPSGAVVMHLDITEQKLAKEELRESERRFSDMLSNVQMASLMLDKNAHITYCNDYLLRLTGWRREDVIGRSWFELFIPPDNKDLRNLRASLLAGDPEARHHENEILTRSGERLLIRWNNSVLRSLSGEVIGTASIGEDITERKRFEAEIHETKNFLASIFDNIPNSIFVKDAHDLRYLRVNTAFESITGYSGKDLLGKSDYEFFPKAQADFFVAKDREAIAGNQRIFIVEEEATSKDGTTKTLRTKKIPISDQQGHPQYLLGMSEDITEPKRAEKALHESETKYRHLIEQADDGIFLSDPNGNFVLVNSRGCELLGYTEKELLGMNGRHTYVEEDKEIHAQRMQAVRTGKTLRFERMVKGKDGATFPAEISLKKLDDGMIQVIFHDITDRRNQEKKIVRLNRIHAVLSGINAAIVRIRDRRELFQEACRIIVEHGRFTLGWIAVLDHATGKLMAVAQAGMPENGDSGSVLFNESIGLVPAGTAEVAIRESHAAVDNDIENAPGLMEAGHGSDTLKVRRAAIALGAKSVIVLPLIMEMETFGILTLYASERNFFDEEEVKLLSELAGDISFSLEFIAKGEKADYLAYYDALTGLANRRLFLERVAQYMRSAVGGDHKLAVFLIDLERFKNINDSLGQPAGDALLKQVAEWLTINAGDANLLARVGSDHFAAVLPEVRQEGDVARLLEKTITAFLEHPFRLDDAVFRIGVKVGVALFPDDSADADMLFKHAEAALKKAKASGDRYLFYTQKMTETVAGKLTLENQLRQALDKEEFVLHYQPQVSLASGKLTGAEALIRWNDPRTGLVPPGQFIPVLEETGLIHEVGRWALRKAVEDYLRWRSRGLPVVHLAVNVSPLQLRDHGFISEIKQAIGIDAHAAEGLEIEITESVIMEDVRNSIASLQAIRAMGVKIAIDDFGTGFSSLSYLAKLPVDTLKIDRSFVVDMTASPEGLALVSTIINLAHALKLTVVAEGVETEEQSRLLRLLDCDEMQGFLFSKPVPADLFESRFLAPPPGG